MRAENQDDKIVREKLIGRGVQTLNDSELLSLLLDCDGSNLACAEALLSKYQGNLASIQNQNIKTLRINDNLGIRNAVRLVSSFELARRLSKINSNEVQTINSNEDIYRIFNPLLSHLDHEEFWVVYLSASNGILDKVKISQGGVTGVAVDHKLIIKRAVELLACGLVLVHNHPSGSAKPSEQDITLTEKLALGASLFEMNLLDHVIITNRENVSFKQLGII